MKKKKRKAAAARKASGDAGSAAQEPQRQEAADLSPAENSGSLSHVADNDAKNESDHGGATDTDTLQLSSSDQLQQNDQPNAAHGTNSDAQDVLFTPQEATKILERFFTVLLMANIPARLALKPFCGQHLTPGKIEEVLQQAGLPNDLVPTELKAFRSLATTNSCSPDAVDGQLLFDQVSAIAFRVEMCELQVRAAVLEYSAGAKTTKAKVDFQRTIAKLTSHLPSTNSQVSSTDFERLLEEKLGLTPGSFLVKITFARITGRPFQRSFPKVLDASKAQFCEAFERFCVNKPLSGESVEGQLRQLVIKFPDMRAAFQQMDLDGSGTISMPEFVAFLQREGAMCFPENVLTAFIKRFDFDGDETLNYDEFIEFVRPKQFGVNVLSPFGMFYLAVDRLEKMRDVVEKIKTRLFWLQHNDLFAVASAVSSASAVAAATARTNGAAQVPTVKLKVTDRFVLTHHFGARRLAFEPTDPIVNVLANGELVVLILTKDDDQQQNSSATNSRNLYSQNATVPPLPPFEYRLQPMTKRNLPPLFSTTEMDDDSKAVGDEEEAVYRYVYAKKRQQPPGEESPWDDIMSNVSSIDTQNSVSLSPGEAEELWQPQQMQRIGITTWPAASTARPPQLPLPAVESESPSPALPPAPASQDSDSDAFELFEDDDADEDGDEALPASSSNDLDTIMVVLPSCDIETTRHHVEVDSDDESPPPPYDE